MRRMTCRGRFSAALGAAMVVALGLSSPATAAKFALSGTWLIRNGQAFIPLQWDPGLTSVGMGFAKDMVHLSMGNLTNATDPNQQAFATARAAFQTGTMAPLTLRVPKERFTGMRQNAIVLSGANLKQITSHFELHAPFRDASLMSMGGPGNFTWCWNDPLCNSLGKPNKGTNGGGSVTNPTRGGRIIYQQGANKFGGSMRFGVASGGLVSVPVAAGPPAQFAHLTFGGAGMTARNLAPGGAYADTEMVYLGRGRVTVNLNAQGTMSFINGLGFFAVGMTTLTNGKHVFPIGASPANCAPGMCITGTGITLTMPGAMILRFTAIGPAPASFLLTGNRAGQITTNFGFPHTTGNVFAQQTTGTGGADFFTAMGSDMRTAMGLGNITTVTAGLSRRNTLAGSPRYGVFHKVTFNLSPFVPSMSPAGFATAGVLMLLAVGYAFRRRIG